jgi:dienelactone hydrolase
MKDLDAFMADLVTRPNVDATRIGMFGVSMALHGIMMSCLQ